MNVRKQSGRMARALVLCGLVAAPAMAIQVDLDMLERGLVHHSVAEGGRFDFAKGGMIYQAEVDGYFSKGYRPENMLHIHGDLAREIHDVPTHLRSYGVFADIVAALEESGFEELYSCEREQCGESAAWRLYLTPLIGGRDETQYYFAGVSGERSHVAIYVNELGGQTRVLIDHLLMYAPEPLAEGPVDISPPLFSPGSAQIGRDSARALGGLAERIRTEGHDKSLLLVGHADSNGGLLRNLLLSGARARAVQQALVESHQIDPARLAIAAYGHAMPSSPHRSGRNQARDRRVEARVVINRVDIVEVEIEPEGAVN